MSFDVVVAADREWGIGKANGLPWPKLKGDLAHFKKITCEAPEAKRNAIVMGRKTWESAEVAGRPLPRRLNVVITRRGLSPPEGVLVVGSLDAALDAAAREVAATFVVGGAEIFREAFAHPQLRYVYLTRVDGAFGCDVKIPDLDALGFVRAAWDGELAAEENGVRYRIERMVPA
ncbi:MAG: dihydrofolate reductase, partial [Deltaproteobacteria bacterium]|nr:dihydrofolate reductase [Deltaproteobacteria bacterium]